MVTAAAPALVDRYTAAFPGSRKRFEVAKGVFPTGVTHDTRMMEPFPVYVTRAKGSRKWDVDGHQLIDYFVGHGARLLGHSPEDVMKAVKGQMTRGTHHGACHDLEIEWGRLVQKLVPCAERVRFTGSGTEATLMALRLSRLFTGRPKFLKFRGHFHGWHDYVTVGSDPPYDSPSVPGVPEAVAANCVAVPPNDLDAVEEALTKDAEIGAVILEPTAAGVRLRNRLNELFEARDWPMAAYGDFSMVRIVPGYRGPRPRTDAGENDGLVPFGGDLDALDGPKNMKQIYAMRQAMLLNGV